MGVFRLLIRFFVWGKCHFYRVWIECIQWRSLKMFLCLIKELSFLRFLQRCYWSNLQQCLICLINVFLSFYLLFKICYLFLFRFCYLNMKSYWIRFLLKLKSIKIELINCWNVCNNNWGLQIREPVRYW